MAIWVGEDRWKRFSVYKRIGWCSVLLPNGELPFSRKQGDTTCHRYFKSVVWRKGESSHNKWFFQYISYIGEDYVSLVYCEITGMGGPNEYNTLEAYTIDCTNGNILTASEILGIQNDAALRCEISDKMGTEQLLTWDELGYYITDKVIVFFGKEYWMQGTCEDVVVWR